MTPLTRNGLKRKQEDVSQSAEHNKQGSSRRKLGPAAPGIKGASESTLHETMRTPAKNEHLKGRRRFMADVNDMQERSTEGYVLRGLQLERFNHGDEEGLLQFRLTRDGCDVLAATLLVSDPSEYPKNHIFFASSPSPDTEYGAILEEVSSWESRTIEETVEKLTSQVARRLDAAHRGDDISDEDTDLDEEFQEYESMDESFIHPTKTFTKQSLQRDFLEVVASDYRPGILCSETSEFILTVSTPVVALNIPGRALMAWDRCLLSKSQRLTLVIAGFQGVYPPLTSEGDYRLPLRTGALKFRVGLTKRYKPGKEQAQDAVREYALVSKDEEPEQDPTSVDSDEDGTADECAPQTLTSEPVSTGGEEDEGRFDKFSLSESLDSLMNHTLMRVIPLRLKFGLGWAGAESLLAEVERSQRRAEDVYSSMKTVLIAADKEERQLAESYAFPSDPLLAREDSSHINLPLVAFSYLVRRLMLCTRYCLVCHNKLNVDYEALKPFVCDSQLCGYQYYLHNRGPSLEYEICTNPASVDLLLSLTYIAAAEGVLEQPLPTGLGLRVPKPMAKGTGQVAVGSNNTGIHLPMTGVTAAPIMVPPVPEETGLQATAGDSLDLVDFDTLSLQEMCTSIVRLIDSLPSVDDMKQHLEKKVKVGKAKPKLKDIDPSILPAAWSVVRWCVGSCTAHLEEITSKEDMVQNIGIGWKQFRFSVGAPDAEAKFRAALRTAQGQDRNAVLYPYLYAFHGSPAKNWHSIIRHGLWYKTITHGRAYGHGVYFAKEGETSTATYAQPTTTAWKNSSIAPSNCAALAEIVNLPSQFTSVAPYLVVPHTHWIVCRYLLVKGRSNEEAEIMEADNNPAIPLVKLDPQHPLTMHRQKIAIPDPSYKVDALFSQRMQEIGEEENDEEDSSIFLASETSRARSQNPIDVDMDVDDDIMASTDEFQTRPVDDWKHDPEWVASCVQHLMPPPVEATPMATVSIQRELKAMLKEQENAKSLRELGWYMPPELIGDNLFQWIVELHSFEKTLPITQDMAAKGINSLVFEIRFPPAFPHSPPFFRIIRPRFLPFVHGGGGHVTGGGSMCMDLLTADGWLPSYSISSVLLQIRLAISNLDPRPARLDARWTIPYGMQEALEGYKRAAATHGWKIPAGLERLVQ